MARPWRRVRPPRGRHFDPPWPTTVAAPPAWVPTVTRPRVRVLFLRRGRYGFIPLVGAEPQATPAWVPGIPRVPVRIGPVWRRRGMPTALPHAGVPASVPATIRGQVRYPATVPHRRGAPLLPPVGAGIAATPTVLRPRVRVLFLRRGRYGFIPLVGAAPAEAPPWTPTVLRPRVRVLFLRRGRYGFIPLVGAEPPAAPAYSPQIVRAAVHHLGAWRRPGSAIEPPWLQQAVAPAWVPAVLSPDRARALLRRPRQGSPTIPDTSPGPGIPSLIWYRRRPLSVRRPRPVTVPGAEPPVLGAVRSQVLRPRHLIIPHGGVTDVPLVGAPPPPPPVWVPVAFVARRARVLFLRTGTVVIPPWVGAVTNDPGRIAPTDTPLYSMTMSEAGGWQ